MPSLSDGEAAQLAGEFDFPGGQIQNVVRKRTIQSLLDLEEPTFDDILVLCREETLEDGSARRKIGF